MNLFNPGLGEALKEAGMNLAASNKKAELAYARSVAIELARKSPDWTITADDVQKVMIAEGINLGNAAGSLFRGKEWIWTGEYVKSKRTSNHASVRRVWRLIDQI